jgi:NAD-dependent deacetylase
MPHDRLRSLIEKAERVLAFTGAGVSTASSIPDFRGPRGIYKTSTPVEYRAFVESEDARIEYWTMKAKGHAVFRNARPNPAHESLVMLERLGKLEALVTQNIDGLHRAAGTSPEKLVELHGTNAETVCLGCRAREPVDRAMSEFERSGEAPRCASCGGLLKPAVVMFGETLDADTLRRAGAAARCADLVMSLGSSLSVTPAADVPLLAARRRIPYVIVNQGATMLDSIAGLVIDDDVGAVLARAVSALGTAWAV